MNPKSMTTIATRRALDPAGAPDRRVAQPGRELRGGDPVRVRLLVDEAERVHRHEARVALLPGALVEELAEADRRRQPEVVAARRAHAHRLLELLVEQLLLARGAAGPHVLGGRRLAPGAEGGNFIGIRRVPRARAMRPVTIAIARGAARAGRRAPPVPSPGSSDRRGPRRAPRDVRDADDGDRGRGDRAAHEERPAGGGPGSRRSRVDGIGVGRVELAAEDRVERAGPRRGPPASRRERRRWCRPRRRGQRGSRLGRGEVGEPAGEALLEPERRMDADERGAEDAAPRAATSGSSVASGRGVGACRSTARAARRDSGPRRARRPRASRSSGSRRAGAGGRSPRSRATAPERAVDEDADRALGPAEDARDLRGAHLLDEPQRQRPAAVVGERLQGAQRLGRLVAGHGLAPRGPWRPGSPARRRARPRARPRAAGGGSGARWRRCCGRSGTARRGTCCASGPSSGRACSRNRGRAASARRNTRSVASSAA